MEKKLSNLLGLRKKIKSKKPTFVRQEINKKKSLGKKWRRPKGLHSKLRLKKAGHRKKPSHGFGSPKKVRYLTLEGLRPKLIKNLSDLNFVKDNEIIILSSKIGIRKKIQVLEKIKELKLKISNIKNIDEFIKDVKEKVKQRKELSKKKAEQKQKEKAKASKKAEEKKPEKTEEEKAEEAKKEKKELTKKLTEITEKKPQKIVQVQTKQPIARPTAPKQK